MLDQRFLETLATMADLVEGRDFEVGGAGPIYELPVFGFTRPGRFAEKLPFPVPGNAYHLYVLARQEERDVVVEGFDLRVTTRLFIPGLDRLYELSDGGILLLR